MSYYKHFKNKPYKVKGYAHHSESLDEYVIYESLYENNLGKIWVRPKQMFFENIDHAGETKPRFKEIQIEIKEHLEIGDKEQSLILGFMKEIFVQYDASEIFSRLSSFKKSYFQVAYLDSEPVGFKLGYELDSKTFYSWLGGVKLSFRGLGVASALMNSQHAWCAKQNYQRIQTKTKNKWREQLVLNIRSGFNIVGTYTDSHGDPKIILVKEL